MKKKLVEHIKYSLKWGLILDSICVYFSFWVETYVNWGVNNLKTKFELAMLFDSLTFWALSYVGLIGTHVTGIILFTAFVLAVTYVKCYLSIIIPRLRKFKQN